MFKSSLSLSRLNFSFFFFNFRESNFFIAFKNPITIEAYIRHVSLVS